MPTIPTVLIALPLLLSFLSMAVRYYVINSDRRVSEPHFLGAVMSLGGLLIYVLINRVAPSGVVSVLFFALAVAMIAATARDLWGVFRGARDP